MTIKIYCIPPLQDDDCNKQADAYNARQWPRCPEPPTSIAGEKHGRTQASRPVSALTAELRRFAPFETFHLTATAAHLAPSRKGLPERFEAASLHPPSLPTAAPMDIPPARRRD